MQRQPQGSTHQLHGRRCAAERTCDIGERLFAGPLAREQIGKNAAGVDGLLASEIIERSILRALQPPFRVPRGLAVADVVDRQPFPSASLPGSTRQSIFKKVLSRDGCAPQVRAPPPHYHRALPPLLPPPPIRRIR